MKLMILLNSWQFVKWALNVLALFLLIWMVVLLKEGITETKNKKERIGETIILFGDTLTIKEYNTNYGYYILSNGLIFEY